MTATTFDPTDPKYQLKDEFKPDKEGTWHYPAEEDGWVKAHNAIRAELDLLQDCFEAVLSRGGGLEEWEIECLQQVFDAHNLFLHEHHNNEDKILAPALAERFKYPEKLTDDHDAIVDALAVLKSKIGGLKLGGSRKESMEDILTEFKAYKSNLKAHLKEEEDIGLPLLRAYFTPAEYMKIIQKIMQGAPKVELGSFIYTQTPEKFRKEFMKQEKIPFFVWYLEFKGALKLYEKEVIRRTDALKAGVQPLPPKRTLLGC